ncbi:MAG TPA: HD domain-containing protein [Candidatus Nanoarchaeia archaeon]|nr:hypothetical protein [uncultured archaeon]
MDDLIKFFVFASRLKFLPRRRWKTLGIPNPETVGDHIYLTTFLAWLFSFGHDFNSRNLMLSSLAHSLDLVFRQGHDVYLQILKENPASLYNEVLPTIPPSQLIKGEKESLNKLLKYSTGFRKEIRKLWEDFRLGKSKEAKFLNTVDKLENLIQALTYKKHLSKKTLKIFWDECYKSTNDARILDFLSSLQEYEVGSEKAVKNRTNLNLIKFIFCVAKLKTIKRKGWLLRGVKNPDSISSHSALSALMVWFLSKRRKLDQSVMFMMILLHDLWASEIGDISPHEAFITRKVSAKKVFESFPWIGMQQEKEIIMRKTLETKGAALERIFRYLPYQFHRELKYLWLEFETGTSPEARFARQVDKIETVIQAMEYYLEDKKISPTSFWLGLKEIIDDPQLSKFVESIDNYYFKEKVPARELVS